MTVIGKHNPLVKEMRCLLDDGGYRREAGRFVLEGARLCADAAQSGLRFHAVLATARAMEQYPAQWALLERIGAAVYEMDEALADNLTDTKHPQGMFAVCGMPVMGTEWPRAAEGKRLLALEDVQDPANLGAIVRTAEALGLAGLVLMGEGCDPYNPKTLRASMGGMFRLPLYRADVPALRAAGYRVLACVPDGDAPVIAPQAGDAYIIGNEGGGVREETIAACDGRVTIPMQGRAESLNAAAAATIVMWESQRADFRRQMSDEDAAATRR
ncbi:MAG: RNA methyltransferase [Oscillospiraceae bacterium]|nr:RNA methyltransferase [Oscillospiraceae bacterium]